MGRELSRSSVGVLSVERSKVLERENLKKEHFTGKHTKHHTLGGHAYPVRHYPVAIRLRTRKGCAILCIALNPQSEDFSGAILGVRSVALLHGKMRKGIRGVNIKNCTSVECRV